MFCGLSGAGYWLLVPEHGESSISHWRALTESMIIPLVDVCLWMSLILLLAPLACRPRSATVTSTHARLLYVSPSTVTYKYHLSPHYVSLLPLPFANWYRYSLLRVLPSLSFA